jgi:5-methylthioadenosine/S-adenosylhomocysteine deaminase
MRMTTSRPFHPRGVAALSRRDLLRAAAGLCATATVLRPSGSVAQPRLRPPAGPYVIDAGWAWMSSGDDTAALQRDVSIVVRDGRIDEVGRGVGRGLPRIDARMHLVLPGFISGHTHVASGTPTRGIIEGGRSYQRPLELLDQLSDEDLDAVTGANLAELIRSGCTTTLDMSLSLRQAESFVRVATRFRARGYPAPMIPGTRRLFDIWYRRTDAVLDDATPDTLREIAEARAFALRHARRNDGLIRPQMAAHATDTHTPDTMRALIQAAREVGEGLHLHLAQGTRESTTVQRLWGESPVRWLDGLGAFAMPCFGAHMAGVDWAADGPLLAARGVVYAHCPSAGGAGGDTQPWPEALAAGVPVNIGIDTHSNDYLENLKLAVLYGQARESLVRASSPVPVRRPTVADALRSATLIPAQALKRPDLGRLRPGAEADLVSIDISSLLVGTGALPPEPLNLLLYGHGLSVRHVMTHGYVQVFHGRFVADDEAVVAARGGAVVQRLWATLEREGWFG